MQILLNQTDLTHAVLGYVNDFITVPEGATVVVEVGEDSTAVIYINEEGGEQPERETQPAGERPPKKPRRTKAQIEADNKAEAERLAQATAAGANGGEDTSGNAVASTEQAAVETPAVVAEAAGETTQEPSAPGEKDPSLDTTVAVEEPAETVAETPATVEEPVVEEPVTPKPTTSLFANLRKPNNQ